MIIEYSIDAIGDLKRLREFIKQNDPIAAAKMGAELSQELKIWHSCRKWDTPF